MLLNSRGPILLKIDILGSAEDLVANATMAAESPWMKLLTPLLGTGRPRRGALCCLPCAESHLTQLAAWEDPRCLERLAWHPT